MADEQHTPDDGADGPKSKTKGTAKKGTTRRQGGAENTAAIQAQLGQHTAQFNELMQGLEKTFGHIHKASSEQTQKLSSLMIGLERAFNTLHGADQARERSNADSIAQVSQTIIRSSEEMRKEYEEMERLHQQQLEAEKERHQYSFNVLKVIAVPAMLLALLGIGYMFYTVTVMERAMTAMSRDMNAMRVTMTEMNGNVNAMAQNMYGMRHDMGVLTHNVAPAMDGMRQMMPWAP